jgi:hypothetical protein
LKAAWILQVGSNFLTSHPGAPCLEQAQEAAQSLPAVAAE